MTSRDTIVSTTDEEFDSLGLRVGVRTGSLSDERLRYINQLGVEDIFVNPTSGGPDSPPGITLTNDHVPSVQELIRARNRIEDAGIRLTGIHSVTGPLYEKIALGEDGAERQLQNYERLVRNAGTAGIPIVGYQWAPGGVYRTSATRRIRGGAKATAYDHDDYAETETESRLTEAEFWDNYRQFLKRVVPAAEDVGVRLAIHPADPPVVDRFEGVPRIFREREEFRKAMDLVPSDSHGLKLCQGCFSEMGADVADIVREFGERDEIVFVHFRDVVGSVPSFHETFVDEGNYDEYEVMRTLEEVGFSGVVVPDHVPQMEGDTRWGHRARGYTVGYLEALITAARAAN
jgi:mannonate dehydratase